MSQNFILALGMVRRLLRFQELCAINGEQTRNSTLILFLGSIWNLSEYVKEVSANCNRVSSLIWVVDFFAEYASNRNNSMVTYLQGIWITFIWPSLLNMNTYFLLYELRCDIRKYICKFVSLHGGIYWKLAFPFLHFGAMERGSMALISVCGNRGPTH